MKPHIEKIGGEWVCTSHFFGLLGHRHRAMGFGQTPREAFADWQNHWGVKPC